jgi:hypothetical protein
MVMAAMRVTLSKFVPSAYDLGDEIILTQILYQKSHLVFEIGYVSNALPQSRFVGKLV